MLIKRYNINFYFQSWAELRIILYVSNKYLVLPHTFLWIRIEATFAKSFSLAPFYKILDTQFNQKQWQ